MPTEIKTPRRPTRNEAAPVQLCNIARLIETMEVRNIDGVIALAATNQYYLSSFGQHHSIPEVDGIFPVVFSRHHPDHPILLMSDIDLERLSCQPTWIKDVRGLATSVLPFGTPATLEMLPLFVSEKVLAGGIWHPPGGRRYYNSAGDGLIAALHDLGLTKSRVAIDNFGNGVALKARLPELDIIPGDGLFRYVRAGKTTAEVELLRRAASINERALAHTVRDWEPDMTWQDLTFAYQVECLKLGGSPNLPDTMAMSNQPGISFSSDLEVEDHPILMGQNIMFDCHGKYNGYCWDGGKSWVVGGSPKRETVRAWAATFAAAYEIQAVARPGKKMSELVAAGLQTFAKHGYGNSGVHIFFHGLGLDHLDQELTMGTKDWDIQKDMVISTHILFPGNEHERLFLEEIILVKPDGAERLFSWDESLFG